MQFDDPFLDELRLLFMEGATVSRLIRRIASQHADETTLHQYLQDCFFRAFGVGPLRISRKLVLTPLDEEGFYSLNRFLIAEMIERYSEWGRHLASRTEPFWKDIQAKSSMQFIEKARPEDVPELADSWEKLDLKAQKYLRRTLGNLDEMFQNVQILARLSERLQGQILDQTPDPAHIKE